MNLNINIFSPLQDCYRHQSVLSSSPVALRGPDMQRSTCLWHLQAAPGTQLELHMEWLLPECRDRLLVYNSLTPTDTHLITSWVSANSPTSTANWWGEALILLLKLSAFSCSVYGCSRHERVVRVLSSGEWMTVVWKQGLYNYKDPFSLSAQAWDHQGENTKRRNQK